MEAFDYLSVLLSIILGLGITQVLTAAGRLIRNRDLVTPYWPPLVWAGVLLVIYVQVWWSMFGLRDHTDWTFGAFLVVLLQTVTVYMLAALVLPETADGVTVDLRTHYERHAPWFFGFLVASVLVSLVKEIVLEGRLPEPANLAFHVFLIATCGPAIWLRRRWYDQALAVGAVVGMGLYITLLFARLR